MLGQTAEAIHSWSSAAYLIALAIVAALTFVIYLSSSLVVREKNRALETYKADAQLQVAAAQRDTEVAKEAAARALERTASLETEAAQAKAQQAQLAVSLAREQSERQRFEAEYVWRTLSAEQRTKLVAELSKTPDKVHIAFVANDPEATFLGIEFQHVFVAAGWTVTTSVDTYPGTVLLGIYVPGQSTPAIDAIRNAMTAARIGFLPSDTPTPTAAVGPLVTSGTRIIIGSKPTAAIMQALQSMSSSVPASAPGSVAAPVPGATSAPVQGTMSTPTAAPTPAPANVPTSAPGKRS